MTVFSVGMVFFFKVRVFKCKGNGFFSIFFFFSFDESVDMVRHTFSVKFRGDDNRSSKAPRDEILTELRT